MLHYSIYGLCLQANYQIPGLLSITTIPDQSSYVKVWLGVLPKSVEFLLKTNCYGFEWHVSDEYGEYNQPTLMVWRLYDEDYWLFKYSDNTQFVIKNDGSEIWATWPDDLTLEDTAVYLLGPVLGFVLRLHDIVCLHASAVVVDGQSIAFVGDTGAGKSTIAAGFTRLGYPVLSDDVVALVDQGDKFLVQPAYPCIRLWPKSVEAIYGATDALPRLVPTHPTWDKRYLDLTQNDCFFQNQSTPLAAIYLLTSRNIRVTSPSIKEVSRQQKMVSLVTNTYTNYLLDKAMRAHEFELLGRLLKIVPLRRLTPTNNISDLNRICEVVLADFRTFSECALVNSHE